MLYKVINAKEDGADVEVYSKGARVKSKAFKRDFALQEEHLRRSAYSQDLPSRISKEVRDWAGPFMRRALEQQLASNCEQFRSA